MIEMDTGLTGNRNVSARLLDNYECTNYIAELEQMTDDKSCAVKNKVGGRLKY
jgi:hypothetical protein